MAWAGAYNDQRLVFCREDGSPHHPALVSKKFKRDAKRAGLPEIRLHDARHSYASVALIAGVHAKVVSARLGHSTVGQTLDTYSHLIPSFEAEAADVIANRIFGS